MFEVIKEFSIGQNVYKVGSKHRFCAEIVTMYSDCLKKVTAKKVVKKVPKEDK